MNAKLENLDTYKMEKPDKRYPNRKRYIKNLKDDYFDTMIATTDLNNIVYQIRLVKDNIYEAQKILNKLQKKYGAFSCVEDKTPFGKIGDNCTCLSKTKNKTEISLSTFMLGSTNLFSVIYTSKYFYKISPKSKKEQKLDNNL